MSVLTYLLGPPCVGDANSEWRSSVRVQYIARRNIELSFRDILFFRSFDCRSQALKINMRKVPNPLMPHLGVVEGMYITLPCPRLFTHVNVNVDDRCQNSD
jgi:hypothetical protein